MERSSFAACVSCSSWLLNPDPSVRSRRIQLMHCAAVMTASDPKCPVSDVLIMLARTLFVILWLVRPNADEGLGQHVMNDEKRADTGTDEHIMRSWCTN